MSDKETKLSKFNKFVHANKKVILTIEIFVFLLCLILSIIGHYYNWPAVVISICDSFFTASFISAITLIINWHTKDEYDNTLKEISSVNDEEKNNLTSAIDNLKGVSENLQNSLQVYFGHNCLFCRTSLIAVYDNRILANLSDFFNKAQKEIGILITSPISIVADDIMCVLRSKAKSGVDIKICAIDVSTSREFINARADSLNRTPKQFIKGVLHSLSELMAENAMLLNDKNNGDAQENSNLKLMQIKTYSVPSSLIMFKSDDEYIISFILNEENSKDLVHFHLKSNGEEDSVNCFKKHFDSVFNSGKEVTKDMVEELVKQYAKD